MTTLAAVTLPDGRVFMAADKRQTAEGRISPRPVDKLAIKGKAVVGLTGWAVYTSRWLPEAAPDFQPDVEPTLSVRDYVARLADSARDWAKERGAPGPTNQGGLISTGSWMLVAALGEVWALAPDGCITRMGQIAADGSGESLALGFLYAAQRSGLVDADPQAAVVGAIECAATFDAYTGDGVDVVAIDDDGPFVVPMEAA